MGRVRGGREWGGLGEGGGGGGVGRKVKWSIWHRRNVTQSYSVCW